MDDFVTRYVGLEVLTAAVTKSIISWDITSSSPWKVNGGLGGTCRFHLQDPRIGRDK
jgi:hypothetical protein